LQSSNVRGETFENQPELDRKSFDPCSYFAMQDAVMGLSTTEAGLAREPRARNLLFGFVHIGPDGAWLTGKFIV
jgi:hypothetical protein